MRRRGFATGCIAAALAACAPRVTAPIDHPAPAPPPAPRPRATASAPAPDAAPPTTITPAPAVCLPDADHTLVSHLDADWRTIHACFVPPGAIERCFAIDRKRGGITPWRASQIAPAEPSRAASVVIYAHAFDACTAAGKCHSAVLYRRGTVDDPIHMAADSTALTAVSVLPDPARRDVPWFDVYDLYRFRRVASIELTDGNRCGEAHGLSGLVMISTSDCTSRAGHGFVVDRAGKLAARVGGDREVNTYGATTEPLDATRAVIVAPWDRALVVVRSDDPTRQLVIDLAPIVAHATDAPSFVVARDAGLTWLVASSTGGIGVFAPDAPDLLASWIIPTCAAPTEAP